MSHDFRNVLFMMRTMRSLGYAQFRAGFCVRPWNDPVEPLFVTVDPQDLRSRLQTPTLLHATAEGNLFHLILGSQAWFYIFRVQRV